jgi:hypothetical protein
VTLLAVGHGTRDPAGVATIRALLDRVRAMRPGLTVAESHRHSPTSSATCGCAAHAGSRSPPT